MNDQRLPLGMPDLDGGRPAPADPVPAATRGDTGDAERVQEEWERRAAAEEDGRDRRLANLQPQTAPVRHGVYSRQGVYMQCRRCPIADQCAEHEPEGVCPHERAYVVERTEQLERIDWIDPVIDGPALSFLVWMEVRLARAARYLAMRGEIMFDGEYVPVAKDVAGVMNSWQRLLATLGLSPPGRRQMAAQGEGAMGELAQALVSVVERERERTAVIEGEVVEEEGERPEQDGQENGHKKIEAETKEGHGDGT